MRPGVYLPRRQPPQNGQRQRHRPDQRRPLRGLRRLFRPVRAPGPEYRDDTDELFRDLAAGEPVSVLLAPSFRASYPKEYGSLLGRLKALGVRRFISVSFGADICTWASLKCLEDEKYRGAISTPCPVVVSYVERYLPELIPHLMPVLSPMLCAAVYCREELGITDRLAFIGPCIGKKLETDSSVPGSPVHYNVTFPKLLERLRALDLPAGDASDEVEYGIGSFYPAAGGLADNVRWFLGDDAQIRVVSGKTYLYGWLKKNREAILERRAPFLLVDALNCQNGCIEGTAGGEGRFEEDGALYSLGEIRTESKSGRPDSPWNAALPPEKRLEMLNRQFSGLTLSHYLRSFTDRSGECTIRYPSEKEADQIFRSMHKRTAKSRNINCSFCGYNSCRDLMVAIYNGFNSRRSCIHYEKEEALRIERLAITDPLTLVMNRTGLARCVQTLLPDSRPIAVIMADINGLKQANDLYGHEAGDNLIVAVASCMGDVFARENVYRLGGDEFMVLLQGKTEEECLAGIRELESMMEKLNVSASVGYAFRDSFDGSLDDLQKEADRNMYEKKKEHYLRLGKTPRH